MKTQTVEELVEIIDPKVLHELFSDSCFSKNILHHTDSAKFATLFEQNRLVDGRKVLQQGNSFIRQFHRWTGFSSLRVGFTLCILIVEMHQKHSIVQNLHDVTSGGAFLIIARGILEDIAAAEGFTITTCFNQGQVFEFYHHQQNNADCMYQKYNRSVL